MPKFNWAHKKKESETIMYYLIHSCAFHCALQPGPSGEPEIAYRKSEKEEVLFPGTQKGVKAEEEKQKENGSPNVNSKATHVHKCKYDHSQQMLVGMVMWHCSCYCSLVNEHPSPAFGSVSCAGMITNEWPPSM